MIKHLTPLWVFLGGNITLLIVFLFLPALGDAGTQLEADTAGIASIFWGWSWVVGSVKLLVFLVLEMLVLFATAKAFLATRNN